MSLSHQPLDLISTKNLPITVMSCDSKNGFYSQQAWYPQNVLGRYRSDIIPQLPLASGVPRPEDDEQILALIYAFKTEVFAAVHVMSHSSAVLAT